MDGNKKEIIGIDVWKYIFLCFAAIILSCAVKNYLVYVLFNTTFCKYLCPSVLGCKVFDIPVFLEKIFGFQSWLLEQGQNAIAISGYDKKIVFSSLIVAPFIEEVMYRGPLFVLRKFLGVFVWWFLAAFLAALFALSHGIYGLSLFPLVLLGLLSSWLIVRTQRFWPSLVLHMLYNFHVISYPLYQSLFWGD